MVLKAALDAGLAQFGLSRVKGKLIGGREPPTCPVNSSSGAAAQAIADQLAGKLVAIWSTIPCSLIHLLGIRKVICCH